MVILIKTAYKINILFLHVYVNHSPKSPLKENPWFWILIEIIQTSCILYLRFTPHIANFFSFCLVRLKVKYSNELTTKQSIQTVFVILNLFRCVLKNTIAFSSINRINNNRESIAVFYCQSKTGVLTFNQKTPGFFLNTTINTWEYHNSKYFRT